MSPNPLTADFGHDHLFLGADHERNERRTWLVVGLTAAMMAGEIAAGSVFGSMALLADGFHMATHAAALAIAGTAYLFARRHARNPRFTFGTGKFGELAGYTSAVILAVIAAIIGYESALRLIAPVPIRFDEAIAVAVLGLAVNLASAWLLHGRSGTGHRHSHGDDYGLDHDHDHHHGHHHSDGHAHLAHGEHRHAPSEHGHAAQSGHHDHNLRAAYFHVLADALTSVLAIAALLAGRLYGWVWMDAVVGIVGAVVIARWSLGLLRGAGAVLLDTVPDANLEQSIRLSLEAAGDSVADLHLWRVGPGHVAAIIAVYARQPRPPAHYKAKLAGLARLSHVTVEVHPLPPTRDAA